MSDEKLNEIKTILEDIRAALFLTNQDNIENAKQNLLKPGSIEETVYKLCDSKNTSSDIASKIQERRIRRCCCEYFTTERPCKNHRKEWKESPRTEILR